MIIPYTELSPETLQAVIEEFITREGTDYGEQELSLAEKVAQIKEQLERKQVFIVYSELHESCDIRPKEQLSSDQAT